MLKDPEPLVYGYKEKRSGWYNLFRLRCFFKSCPCRMTRLDEKAGWRCVDCGELKGVFGELYGDGGDNGWRYPRQAPDPKPSPQTQNAE